MLVIMTLTAALVGATVYCVFASFTFVMIRATAKNRDWLADKHDYETAYRQQFLAFWSGTLWPAMVPILLALMLGGSLANRALTRFRPSRIPKAVVR